MQCSGGKLPKAMTGGREIALEGVPTLLAMGIDCYLGDADIEAVKVSLDENRTGGAQITSVGDGLTMVSLISHVCTLEWRCE
jgi:hypothetical protein